MAVTVIVFITVMLSNIWPFTFHFYQHTTTNNIVSPAACCYGKQTVNAQVQYVKCHSYLAVAN